MSEPESPNGNPKKSRFKKERERVGKWGFAIRKVMGRAKLWSPTVFVNLS